MLTYKDLKMVLREGAELRGRQEYDKAVELMESYLEDMDPATRVKALLEIFYAAKAKGDFNLAKSTASRITQLKAESSPGR